MIWNVIKQKCTLCILVFSYLYSETTLNQTNKQNKSGFEEYLVFVLVKIKH